MSVRVRQGFHTYLVSTNQTTYENFRYSYARGENPYDRRAGFCCLSVDYALIMYVLSSPARRGGAERAGGGVVGELGCVLMVRGLDSRRGCVSNCLEVWCSPPLPKKVDFTVRLSPARVCVLSERG